MVLLFFLAALLGLVFPPLAVVVLAAMILGVFAKGVIANSQEQIVRARRKTRRRHGAGRAQAIMHHHIVVPPRGKVIDVRCYPILFPPRLPKPMPQSLDGLRIFPGGR
ncbi:MAG: hypothetical protein ACLP9L_02610 [Thermoguttaceae bacterium]